MANVSVGSRCQATLSVHTARRTRVSQRPAKSLNRSSSDSSRKLKRSVQADSSRRHDAGKTAKLDVAFLRLRGTCQCHLVPTTPRTERPIRRPMALTRFHHPSSRWECSSWSWCSSPSDPWRLDNFSSPLKFLTDVPFSWWSSYPCPSFQRSWQVGWPASCGAGCRDGTARCVCARTASFGLQFA